jgi:hypothetical protein
VTRASHLQVVCTLHSVTTADRRIRPLEPATCWRSGYGPARSGLLFTGSPIKHRGVLPQLPPAPVHPCHLVTHAHPEQAHYTQFTTVTSRNLHRLTPCPRTSAFGFNPISLPVTLRVITFHDTTPTRSCQCLFRPLTTLTTQQPNRRGHNALDCPWRPCPFSGRVGFRHFHVLTSGVCSPH